MKVQKRNGKFESVKLDKILGRIKKQTYGLSDVVDPFCVAQKVIAGIFDGITTVELDNLAAETSASMGVDHPDYLVLAGRLAVSAHHKHAKRDFSEVVKDLYEYIHERTGQPAGLIDEKVYTFVMANADRLNEAIVFDRDFQHDYFGFKTLEKSYLLKIRGKQVECPQHMWMRVAVGIWQDNIDEAIKTYDYMSQGYFTHATPTLFNAGTKRPQLSSCFLLTMEDSLENIYKTLSDCAAISKNAGGIGISAHEIRSKGAYIKGTNGTSNGLIPMLKVFNETARYVDQCFAGETPIQTDSGLVAFQDLQVGNRVKTTDGSFHAVTEIKSFNYTGDMVSFSIDGTNLLVTPEHPILVVRDAAVLSTEIIEASLSAGMLTLEWVNAGDITQSDLIVSPV